MPLCDTILHLAAVELFEPYWSESILIEVGRTLAKFGKTPEQIARRLSRMHEVFPEAIVDGFDDLVSSMTNDLKDRHVLAAAVHANVNQLVTQNVRHFPAAATEPYGVQVRVPDAFLMNVLSLFPKQTLAAIRRQANALRRENGIHDVVRKLAVQVPQFAQSVDALVRAGA